MNRTPIPWVKNPDGIQGYTWNPITGCLNHVDGLCKGGGFPCYAYRLANGRLEKRYLQGGIVSADCSDGDYLERIADPFYPRYWPERLQQIPCTIGWWSGLNARRPRGVFVCDMSDLFGIGVPEAWTREVLGYIQGDPADRFYLLTKQPQNLQKWSPFPSNAWVGVTLTNDGMMTLALTRLASVEASVRYLSIEPLLGFISMKSHPLKAIKWLIIGACTGTRKDMEALCQRNPGLTLMQWGKKWTAQPNIERVKEIVDAADRVGIKVFLKHNLKPLLNDARAWAFSIEKKWPQMVLKMGERWELRQEMPV